MTFEFESQILGPWSTAQGFIVQQFQSLINQLSAIAPMLGLQVPYPASCSLITDVHGNPSWAKPQPTPIAIVAAAEQNITLNPTTTYLDWNPTNWDQTTALVLQLPAQITLQSLKAPNPLNGVFKLIANAGGSNNLLFLNRYAGSNGGNQFRCPGSATYTLTPGSAIWIWYDVANRIWQIMDKA